MCWRFLNSTPFTLQPPCCSLGTTSMFVMIAGPQENNLYKYVYASRLARSQACDTRATGSHIGPLSPLGFYHTYHHQRAIRDNIHNGCQAYTANGDIEPSAVFMTRTSGASHRAPLFLCHQPRPLSFRHSDYCLRTAVQHIQLQ